MLVLEFSPELANLIFYVPLLLFRLFYPLSCDSFLKIVSCNQHGKCI